MTAASSLPATWGPALHNQQFLLWQEGRDGVTDSPVSLEGHGLDTGSPELSDRITYTRTRLIRGRLVPVMQTLRSPIEMAVTYNIGIPSAIWTPVQQASFTGCVKTFFLEYLCPDDAEFAHWIILEKGTMSPAIEAVALMVPEDTGEAITSTTEISVERRLWGWNLAYKPYYQAGVGVVLNGITFLDEECPDCDDAIGTDLLTAGGDAAAKPAGLVTGDRFSTVVAPDIGALLDVAYTVFSSGSLQLVAIGDNADISAATIGSVWRSTDGGFTFVVVPTIDILVYKFLAIGDDILAIGVTTAGAAAIEVSSDQGGSFTPLTSTILPAAEALISAAYDPGTQKLYFGGAAGTLLVGRLNTVGLNLIDITANLSVGPAAITAIVLMEMNNVIVAGSGGVVEETRDGGVIFTQITFPNTDDIVAAAGNKYRLVLGAVSTIYERSFQTRNVILPAVIEEGIVLTGNITDVAMNIEDDFNRIAVCTDDGEVVLGIPRYPDA